MEVPFPKDKELTETVKNSPQIATTSGPSVVRDGAVGTAPLSISTVNEQLTVENIENTPVEDDPRLWSSQQKVCLRAIRLG